MLADLRFSVRSLRRSPAFAVLAVLTLALGIGANTAIFSVVDGVLLRPLPYPEPGELVLVRTAFPGLGFDTFWVSAPEFLELRDNSRSFASLGAYVPGTVNLSDADRPLRARSLHATAGLFEALGVPAARGRWFDADEDAPGAPDVAVLSHGTWSAAFGGDPDIVGRTVRVDGVAHRVVGVAPAGFDVHEQGAEVFLPLGLDPADPGGRGSHYLVLLGRLAPGTSPTAARAELASLTDRWPELAGDSGAGGPHGGPHVPNAETHPLRLDPLFDDIVGEVRPALLLLLGAVGLVLLVACANVGNLLLFRAEARQKEIAVRNALGAGRWRLLRQLLVESLVLGLLGGVAGVGLAAVGLRVLLALHPESLPRTSEIGLDPSILGFTLAISLLAGLLLGTTPALSLTKRSLGRALREGGQRASASRARLRVRRVLLVAEVAMALVLVVGAGLLLRSLWNLLRVDLGFRPGSLVTFQVSLPRAEYPEDANRVDLALRLEGELARLPGVDATGVLGGLPPARRVNANDTEFEGYEPGEGDPPANVDFYQFVSPGALGALGARLVAGRGLEAADGPDSLPVVLVNETLARRYWPDGEALGRRLRPGWGDGPWLTVVGVVADLRNAGIGEEVGSEIFIPLTQATTTVPYVPATYHLVVRSGRPLGSLAPEVRRLVAEADPGLPVAELRTMEDVLGGAMARARFLSLLLGIFAAVALALAAVGTYGVLGFSVAERRQEIGVRRALGARPADVVLLVLRQGLGLTAVGIALGLAGAVAAGRGLGSLLYGVEAVDPWTFGLVPVFLLGVALLACLVPTRKALRIDPVRALRHE